MTQGNKNTELPTQVFANYIIGIINFVAALVIAFLSSRIVSYIPAPDSNGILSIYNSWGYHPIETLGKILWIIIGTQLIFKLLTYLSRERQVVYRYGFIVALLLVLFFIKIMPNINAFAGNIDTFHHGEQLAPASAYLNGKALYTDMFVLHGVGEDVLTPALALSMSPHKNGIGTYYFLITTLGLVSALLFLMLLSHVFKPLAAFMLVSTWFVFASDANFWYVRDGFVWTTLLLVFALLTVRLSKSRLYLFEMLLSILTTVSLLYSFDRGILCLVILFTYMLSRMVRTVPSKRYGIALSVSVSRPLIHRFVAMAIASLAPLLILWLTLGSEALWQFVSTYLITISREQGIMFNYPLPNNIGVNNYWLWLPVILACSLTYAIISFLKQSPMSSRHTFAYILLAASFVSFQIAYGRYDEAHVAYGLNILYITAWYIVFLILMKYKRGQKYHIKKSLALEHTIPLLFGVIVMILITLQANPLEKLYASASLHPTYMRDYVTLPMRSDAYWVPPSVQEVADYIKRNTKPSDKVFVFTQQPIYYYLTGRENPSRYYIPWFADANTREEELLQSLNTNKPSLVVYKSGNGWDNPDGFTMQQRTPRVDKWIKENYTVQATVNGVEILTRP